MNSNAHIENPNDPGFICKPELTVSGLAEGKILLDEILLVSEGYVKRDSILKISLTESYLQENDTYTFNAQDVYKFILGDNVQSYYLEKIEEVGDVTVIHVYGKTVELEKIFGTLEAKSLSEVYLEISGELQLAAPLTCQLSNQDPEIRGVTSTSVIFDSNELNSNFSKIRVRYKKINDSTWLFAESSTSGSLTLSNLEENEIYIASYMKYCSSTDWSFYSKNLSFKTF